MAQAIIEMHDLSKLFADFAPLYEAKPILENWLAKYDVAIAHDEHGYEVITFDRISFSRFDPFKVCPTYGAALVIALDECVARAKEK